MDMTLEVIPLPVSDIDRARDFYRDGVGFHVDIDQEVVPGMRIVQLTPPGSGCSIALGDTVWDTMAGPAPPPAPTRASSSASPTSRRPARS
ncbi:Catechol 2,3-dioxygenase-like lactoylglutathione lyase family enzyme OS=Streptomyces griseomycini OX=66895 GN=FHS37_000471 PE=4 SV=1 [Streptomyces griseomycini]